MAEGLSAAHAYGVVHRDFKSDNVMLVPASANGGPRVVVTDFGMAQSAEPSGLTTSTGLKGTPAYMAPEQVSSGNVGPAADVYALGIVMYEMMTGELPFRGGTAMEVAVRRLTTEPQSRAGWCRIWISAGRGRSCVASSASRKSDTRQPATWRPRCAIRRRA